jgi:Fe-S cluster biogenesis protein NfuA
LLAIEGVVSVLFRGHTLTVERRSAQPWPPIERAVVAIVSEHFLLGGGPLAPAVGVDREGMAARVWAVIAERVAPNLQRDGGDIELVEVRDGVVRVHLVGACRSCPASETTLKLGVEHALRQAFPEEKLRVESVG